MKSLKKVIYAGLFLILSSMACFSQNLAENDSLSFKKGSFSNQYYIGNQSVSYGDFITKLSDKSKQAVKMFKTGRSMNIAGMVIGCIGAYGVGYDLGGRLYGGKGNTALLVGGGSVMVGGIILSSLGEDKMKKALTLYKKQSLSLSFGVTESGVGLSFNF
jgi:hypothetical protein